MARISKYIDDESFSPEDKVIGSSYIGTVNGVKQYKTRNFSMESLVERLGDKSLVVNLSVSEYNTTVPNGWLIQHNLSKFPSVSVIDSAGSSVLGDIEYINENSIKLMFSSGFSGKAYIN